mgnify:CR=1 FL=1
MKARKPRYIWAINIFIGITVLAIVGILYLTLVHATIRIQGDREKFVSTGSITVNKIGADNTVAGTLISKDYELSESFPVAGTGAVGTTAGGSMKITNNYNKDQSLVKTTRFLSTDGKIFRTVAAITIPAGSSATVEVRADKDGSGYLVPAGHFTIPGLWEGIQDKIYGETTVPMAFLPADITKVSDDDVKKAEENLTAKIIEQALLDVKQQAPANYDLKPELVKATPISIVSDPVVGTKSSQIKVTVKTNVSALIVNADDVKKAATDKLMSELPDKNNFIELVADSFSFSVQELNATDGTARVKTALSAWIKSNTLPTELDTHNFTGKSASDVKKELESKNIKDAEVIITPPFVPFMPFLADHIKVEVR